MGLAEKENGESIHFLKTLLNAVTNSFGGNYWWKDVHGVYRGCNQKVMELLGLDSVNDIIGKTDYELPWKETADQLIANDNLVISSKEVITHEESAIDAKGEEHIFQVTKAPLFDENNEVIGTIGTSIDITFQKEAEKLRLENERQQISLQEKENFAQLARKVAHDINSPLAALKVLAERCDDLPENQRSLLRRATESILDITNNLISNYQNKDNSTISDIELRHPLLVSDLLIQLLSEKKVQYLQHAVTFETEFADDAHFAFIHIQKTEFRRMMSNLINNAVDALEGRADGTVITQLFANNESVIVKVKDNGKGMSRNQAEKMLKHQSFTEGKENGHGLGLQQVWDTLSYNQGAMGIESVLDKGTAIQLTFPRSTTAKWIAQEIHLIPDNIVVVLDDDESIQLLFQPENTRSN